MRRDRCPFGWGSGSQFAAAVGACCLLLFRAQQSRLLGVLAVSLFLKRTTQRRQGEQRRDADRHGLVRLEEGLLSHTAATT